MNKVYLVSAKRTAIGSFGGAFKSVPASALAAEAVTAALAAANVDAAQVDELLMGNVIAAGQGMGPGRQAAIAAGLPEITPAYTVNMICGSGMKVVMDGAAHIKAGDANVVVACGGENMSRYPYVVTSDIRFGTKMGNLELSDTLIDDGLTDVFNKYHMGITAENVAEKLEVSREEQDNFALQSQQRALNAIESGKFVDEIVPLEVTVRRKTNVIATDEYPKVDVSSDGLTKMRAAFKREGTVTAGNASGLNDGGSAIILASESAVEKYDLKPIAELVSYAQSGIDPAIMGLGPVPAIAKALSLADLTLQDIELLELNEAFAAQALGVMKQLCNDHQESLAALTERTNVNGGAIALGHPLGASGNRIIVTLLHEMKKRGNKLGLASLCIGGGMGTAVIVKSLD
ncbi:acetyl-CoA C-acetyltransferase [Thalassotalea sp. ND16A]|uniref:acetyl-CoA C-acetyltransferase n=1 Tax=Thalassotalea sp. ND16A TaxID=1535422 RepID=UPI00051A5C33|nr:acetyl-CoA C-acetyltransferase [Thalassotalea sp. ND16A]KGJ99660.1 Acetyl-CoA C-acetyltransferase [Thalassotalea sp. ND16A]